MADDHCLVVCESLFNVITGLLRGAGRLNLPKLPLVAGWFLLRPRWFDLESAGFREGWAQLSDPDTRITSQQGRTAVVLPTVPLMHPTSRLHSQRHEPLMEGSVRA